MSARGGSGSPGSASSPRSAPAVDDFRAGLRAARSPVRADRSLRPVAVPLAGRGPDRRLRPARPGCRPRPPASSTGSASSGWWRASWRSTTPGCARAQAGAAAPERIGIYLGSALGGIAYAEVQHESTWSAGIRPVAPNLALAVFGGAAPANLGIALDVRGPILSTANSCASGAVALGEALGAIRAGEIDAAIAGGVEVPLSPARVRCVRHHPGAVGRPQRRPGRRRAAVRRRPRRLRHGRGRGAARPRGRRRRAGTRRRAVRRGPRLRRDLGRPPHGPAARRRPRGGARGLRSRSRTPGVAPDEIDYVNAHASSTPIGDIAEARAIAWRSATARVDRPGERDEGAVRPPARGVRGDRGGDRPLAIREGWAPPTVNLVARRPDIAALLPGLLRDGRARRLRARAVDSFGFGGLNAALVFGTPRT